MGKKEEIFSKLNIKNYKNELENILDEKNFSEDAKNLILSIFYKIDVTFQDYSKVKVETLTKREIEEELIDIIKDSCKEIEIIKPEIDDEKAQKKYIVSKEENKILVFPNANILIFALYALSPNKFKVKRNYEIIAKPVENMLNAGREDSKCEIIRDFDGWNWNIEKDTIQNTTYNLLYQLINILLGNNFFEKQINSKDDIIKEIEDGLEILYGKDLANNICHLIYKICILEYIKEDVAKIKQMVKTKELLQEEVKNMENKKQYLQNLAESKKFIGKRIREIDKTLSDNKLLKEDFIKNNAELDDDHKVFSISDFVDLLQKERKQLIKELELYSNLMKPVNYIKTKAELKTKIKLLENLKTEDCNIENDIYLAELDLQELFLDAIKIKIENADTKKEIIELIYKIRYYKLLPIGNNQIKDVKELDKKLKKIEKILITKACKTNAMSIICSKISENYKIMSKILESKIIDLEKISIEFKKRKEEILLNIYDDNVIDSSIEYKNIEELNVKLNKKIKIFS